MPSTVKDKTVKSVAKRKRSENGEPIKKRKKLEAGEEKEDLAAQIQKLESQINESKKHYNNIATLIEYAEKQDEDPKTAIAAAEALCRVFVRLLASGSLVKKKDASEKDATVAKWLRDRLTDHHKALVAMFKSTKLATRALVLAMALLKAEAPYLEGKDEAVFPWPLFNAIISALLTSPVEEVRDEFCDKFIDEYDDLRFYAFEGIKDFLTERQSVDQELQNTVFDFLLKMEHVPESSEDLEDFYIEQPSKKKHPLRSLSQHKKRAQEAWLALFNLGLSKEQRKKVLDVMASSIAPWFIKPELLMDFLTDCYNTGGSISLLALSGVFYLIQERNLDYPSFYQKLYSLLDTDILHSKYRSRFFRLLDTFLGSSHLPAVLVASFIKRLARLALNAPPSAIVVIVPWFYNLFKKHPLTTFMMHRVPRTKEEKDLIETEGVLDPFLPDEQDPMETHAIDSCLWEIVQLQSHYHPNVATIAKIISEQFTKQFYNLEDFLDHSYGSLIDAEMLKEVKKAPVIEFMIPKHIFTKADAGTEQTDSPLVSLWDFGSS
ncbi:CBF/Mak21 family-domain-containing protein [Pseudoneurospora amorphoporcata]|uniref:CBF/Mak21 family-domain-containing protein n=1 Tax=Pseudoneurospora amorphoporcata TaxID=241081 RepID=A0AAN6SF78_9PEZI|nr:CBF/Mak21 family-domain-containing protein [Pseudoneurospora amorphoporcata]